MDSLHKAFDVIGTATGRTSCGLRCKFCNDSCRDEWKFCITCGYPLKLSTSCLSTLAPESLVSFAKQWHTGELSALYNVQGGRILHRNLLLLVQELKAILDGPMDRGPTFREVVEGHLKALEYLHVQSQ